MSRWWKRGEKADAEDAKGGEVTVVCHKPEGFVEVRDKDGGVRSVAEHNLRKKGGKR